MGIYSNSSHQNQTTANVDALEFIRGGADGASGCCCVHGGRVDEGVK